MLSCHPYDTASSTAQLHQQRENDYLVGKETGVVATLPQVNGNTGDPSLSSEGGPRPLDGPWSRNSTPRLPPKARTSRRLPVCGPLQTRAGHADPHQARMRHAQGALASFDSTLPSARHLCHVNARPVPVVELVAADVACGSNIYEPGEVGGVCVSVQIVNTLLAHRTHVCSVHRAARLMRGYQIVGYIPRCPQCQPLQVLMRPPRSKGSHSCGS